MRDGEETTAGMKMVQKYRARMSRLSDAERQRLMERGLQIIYGEAPATKSARFPKDKTGAREF